MTNSKSRDYPTRLVAALFLADAIKTPTSVVYGIASPSWRIGIRMVPEIPTDIPRDPDVGSSENTLPDSRGAGTLHDHLGLHAITQATLTVLVQAVFYALIIVCILFLVSFIVECSGWLRESKRRHGERKGSIARSLRTSESKSRYPEDGQKRSVISEHPKIPNCLY